MSFPALADLQGINLHPPVLRKNQPHPPIPSPPGSALRMATRVSNSIKAAWVKIKQRVHNWKVSGSYLHKEDTWSMEGVAHESTIDSQSFVDSVEDA